MNEIEDLLAQINTLRELRKLDHDEIERLRAENGLLRGENSRLRGALRKVIINRDHDVAHSALKLRMEPDD